MIVKEYFQNINIHKPRDYFERWYADVWHKHINKPTAAPGELEPLLVTELAKFGGTIGHKDNGYRFVVTFENNVDYTSFVLRWI